MMRDIKLTRTGTFDNIEHKEMVPGPKQNETMQDTTKSLHMH